jgi:hypothetical protein
MAKALLSDTKNLGDFNVSRSLPNQQKKMVGPFIFFDHMGPAELQPGQGIDVRPHPHIGLSTLTYLFEGSMLHRDSLGYVQEIHPGDVNWMTAGKGIVHSERQTLTMKGKSQRLNGIQLWIALPKDKTEIEPSFQHVPQQQLPNIHKDKLHLCLIAGEAYGYCSPVRTHSPLFYIDCLIQAGGVLDKPAGEVECAIYIQTGVLEVGGRSYSAGEFVLLDSNDKTIEAKELSRFLMLGGPAFDDTPSIFWNFVAYSKARMDAAKQQWREGKFPSIPNDNEEYIPLPD